MPADLHPAPPLPLTPSLDAATTESLRRLSLACSLESEPRQVLAVLRAGIGRLDGADALEVLSAREADEDAAERPLASLAARARQESAVLVAGAGSALPAPAGLRRAVAVPLRVRGEPAALALGWSGRDPGAERARGITAALGEQAVVALTAAGRYVELRDAAYRRDRFFSAMSHDLRTPITAIVGYSELLHDGIVGPLTERQQEMVERICQVSSELAQLVTDMLDLSKLDAGRMEFHRERDTLQALVDSGVEGAEPHLANSGSRVQCAPIADAAAVVHVDRARLRQVLANMVAHGAYAAPRRTVRVAAGCDVGDVWIRVTDGGPALPPGSEEVLFEALPRAAGRTGRSGPGAALSLALSRRIARAMGGELEAAGLPEGGAALTLRLPRGTP